LFGDLPIARDDEEGNSTDRGGAPRVVWCRGAVHWSGWSDDRP